MTLTAICHDIFCWRFVTIVNASLDNGIKILSCSFFVLFRCATTFLHLTEVSLVMDVQSLHMYIKAEKQIQFEVYTVDIALCKHEHPGIFEHFARTHSWGKGLIRTRFEHLKIRIIFAYFLFKLSSVNCINFSLTSVQQNYWKINDIYFTCKFNVSCIDRWVIYC